MEVFWPGHNSSIKCPEAIVEQWLLDGLPSPFTPHMDWRWTTADFTPLWHCASLSSSRCVFLSLIIVVSSVLTSTMSHLHRVSLTPERKVSPNTLRAFTIICEGTWGLWLTMDAGLLWETCWSNLIPGQLLPWIHINTLADRVFSAAVVLWVGSRGVLVF
jgi:hypothetical protein